jgi:toxin-antitoxin system PIN domain toxin
MPLMRSRGDLLDINVWLALSFEDHPHHARARQYWYDEAVEEQAFCSITALGFLRLCTNDTVMAGQPLSVSEAWAAYAAYRELPEVILVAEPVGCEAVLAAWATGDAFTSRLWTDAYLAAFATAGDLRLVSFDGDFARFDGLHFLHLQA